jgi:hemerythrin superfamily protein
MCRNSEFILYLVSHLINAHVPSILTGHNLRRNEMDIYSYLKKDHRRVNDMMEQVMRTHSPAKRQELYARIQEELELHAETEEETFYAALKLRGGKQLQEKEGHAEEEHDEIRKFLKQIDHADPKSDAWLLAFGQLKHAVEHHVMEEEGEIFDKAKKVISDARAEELAEEMEALKRKKTGRAQDQEEPSLMDRIFA